MNAEYYEKVVKICHEIELPIRKVDGEEFELEVFEGNKTWVSFDPIKQDKDLVKLMFAIVKHEMPSITKQDLREIIIDLRWKK